MYADRERQREAMREANRRYRLRKGITKVSQDAVFHAKVSQGITPEFIKGMGDWAKQRGMVDMSRHIVPLPEGVTKRRFDRDFGKPVVSHHPTCRCFVCKPPK
jgi:hypothetical protein